MGHDMLSSMALEDVPSALLGESLEGPAFLESRLGTSNGPKQRVSRFDTVSYLTQAIELDQSQQP